MPQNSRNLESDKSSVESPEEVFDAVIVGAGFAGLYQLYKLRQLGLRSRVFETAGGVGGTWYWNRYPGARCDVDSLFYAYSFSDELQRDWEWRERYSTQSDILRYANHVADRFDLRRDIQFNTQIVSATYDKSAKRWFLVTDQGETVSATWCIMATGCLSMARVPDFKGIEHFCGKQYHTGRWPHETVDFTGLRVGVIGTGSSGVQSIPVIAQQADHLFVFQRTANFSVPARNAKLDPAVVQDFRDHFKEYRAMAREGSLVGELTPDGEVAAPTVTSELTAQERTQEYEKHWQTGGALIILAYPNLLTDKKANDTAADFVRAKILDIVDDPEVAMLLTPTDHPLGTKRICVDTNYFETFNRSNVTLVDIRTSPIEEFTESGLSVGGKHYPLDAVVFATGFDAMTGALLKIDIRGSGGRTLAEKWAEGPRAYLGVAISGFPNLFVITGPGSPSVLSNVINSIEQHVDWITDFIRYARDNGVSTVEAQSDAEDRWVAHVAELAERTLFPQVNSWYVGANIPGKPRIFSPYVGGVGLYRRKCDEIAAQNYVGFQLEK